jgi:hypothetical protein
MGVSFQAPRTRGGHEGVSNPPLSFLFLFRNTPTTLSSHMLRFPSETGAMVTAIFRIPLLMSEHLILLFCTTRSRRLVRSQE